MMTLAYLGALLGVTVDTFTVFMWVGMTAFVAVVLALVLLIGRLTRPAERTRRDEPLDIAARRYARGEMSREEYERLRDDLTDKRAA